MKYIFIFLISIFAFGCAINNAKIEPPPNIKTVYYYDDIYDVYYESIESDVYPITMINTNNKEIRKARFIKIETINGTCDFVLAYYSNGKTSRIKTDGSKVCN